MVREGGRTLVLDTLRHSYVDLDDPGLLRLPLVRGGKVLSVGEEAAQVTGEVKPGEKIVALGAHLLHEGEAVRLAGQPDTARTGDKP